MEIILNGPGGTVSTWKLTEAAYDYWKNNIKPMPWHKGMTLFDLLPLNKQQLSLLTGQGNSSNDDKCLTKYKLN